MFIGTRVVAQQVTPPLLRPAFDIRAHFKSQLLQFFTSFALLRVIYLCDSHTYRDRMKLYPLLHFQDGHNH